MKHPAYILLAFFFLVSAALKSQVTVNLGPDLVLNCNVPSVQITPVVSGATSPIYQWSGPGNYSSNNQNITVNLPGTYTLTVTDQANGNTATDQINILEDIVPPNVMIVKIANSCSGQPGSLSIANPVGNLLYQWSNGAVGTAIDALSPGVYCVTATDPANGCTAVDCEILEQYPQIAVTVAAQAVHCYGGADGSLIATVFGGQPPYSYLWNTGASTPGINGLQAGLYTLTVTDAAACTSVQQFTVTQPAALTVSAGNGCNNTLLAQIAGGVPPYLYQWSGPNFFNSNFLNPLIPGPGIYSVTVTDANGCISMASDTISPSDEPCTKIYGRAVLDADLDCEAEPQEIAWANMIIRATGANGTFYAFTDTAGAYTLYVVPGNYTVYAQPNDQQAAVCPLNPGVSLSAVGDSVRQDFAVTGINPDCPLMRVDLTASLLRRCFNNNYYWVSYCNLRPVEAPGAYIELRLDPFLSFVSAALPHTDLGNNTVRFDLGDVGPNACGLFWVQVEVSCNAVLGQTHCSEAHIFPDTLCNPADPLWSGAELRLRAECAGDSLDFILKNVGTAPMSNNLEYIVIEDGLMNRAGSAPPLAPNQEMYLRVPANGATWRVEAEQEPYAPNQSLPLLSVEGCTTTGAFTTGFVSQFPANDYDEWVDIECRPNQGSYDPNDKQGFPTGYGADHYIKPGTEIEYLIRFQNTGTDTAFNVYILDTLSSWLDPASVQPGASSHNYRFELRGEGVLLFQFPNIMLPDSNVNEPASNGFVKFRIRPRPDVPLETDIFNNAAIYFDFNEPIITNTTQHRIGENFISVATWDPRRPQYQVSVAPNPAIDRAVIRLTGSPETGNYQLLLTDPSGRTARTLHNSTAAFELQRGDLPTGVYFFQVRLDGELCGLGKLILR